MKKNHSAHSFSPAAAILTGGLLFTGPASAAVVFSEDFESAGNAFSMPIYTYAENYTQTNGLTPGGGIQYATGGTGPSNLWNAGTRTLVTGGITGTQIDAGQTSYNFYAQFSAYRTQSDNSEVQVQFLDGANAPLGSLITFGGLATNSTLSHADNGSYADAASWAAESRTGVVPAGARSVAVQVLSTRFTGNAIDGYLDNVILQVNAVPEAGTVTLSGLSAALLLFRRRRA